MGKVAHPRGQQTINSKRSNLAASNCWLTVYFVVGHTFIGQSLRQRFFCEHCPILLCDN